MAKVYPEIRKLGGEVLAVSFAKPERVRAYLERDPLPFPVVSDPEMTVYRAFALGRTRLRSFLRPTVVWRYLKLMFQGWKPNKPGEGDDVLQLGGDFVLDGRQRLVYAHPSKDGADRPAATELLNSLADAPR